MPSQYDPVIKWRSKEQLEIGSTKWNRSTGSTAGPLKPSGYGEHQVIVSQSNRVSQLGKTRQDIGGPFESRKVFLTSRPTPMVLTQIDTGGDRRRETGHLVSSGAVSSILTEDLNSATSATTARTRLAGWVPTVVSDSSLDIDGTFAINRVLPTSPVVDGAESIAELLREGFPQPIGSQGNIGSEYLNIQFGHAPLLADSEKLQQAITKSDEILKQLERDSGRLIRRRHDFGTEVTTSGPTVTTGTPVRWADGRVPEVYVAELGTLTKVSRLETKRWFSGAFTYHLPPADSWRRKMRELDRLYGVKPGIDTLWNLMPWSWLYDYFANTGIMLENMNAFASDGLVMPYGYMMVTKELSVTESWTGLLNIGGVWGTRTISSSYKGVVKQRRRATPYGFGFTGSLNPRQVAILAALGMSRV